MPEFRFRMPVEWALSSGQHWAVIGPNGAGKTIITDMLTGKIPLKEGEVLRSQECDYPGAIKSVTFRDIYDVADYKNMYYQQRWNTSEADQSPLIKDLMGSWDQQDYLQELLRFFHAEDLLDKRLILLSSGELRKFLIIKMLLSKPAVLILDNPYIGLDAPSRLHLNDLLQRMASMDHLQIILVLSNPDDIPEIITNILPVYDKQLLPPVTRENFIENQNLQHKLFPQNTEIPDLPLQEKPSSDYQFALQMNAVNIKYGDRAILQNLSWEVRRGEKWALLGPNGAGKSTLLSLVCADNPQSYANHFYLFDKKRGSGESIWEIKKRIGYISPEVHLYYLQDVPSIDVVGSGFFDSIGLYRKCTQEQYACALEWMKIFGIENLQHQSFLKISYGEQRLILLARAFVKNPELLILDEPLHGLDKSNKIKAGKIIERFCWQNGKTLIYVTHYPHEIPPCVTHRFVLTKS